MSDLTDEQISEIVDEFDAGHWIDGEYRIEGSDMLKLARALLSAGQAAPAAVSAEPIYQVRLQGSLKWLDMTKDEWDLRVTSVYDRRIVYALSDNPDKTPPQA